MNQMSGYVEVTIGGELLPFKFGTNAYALYCEMHSIDLNKIAESGLFGKVEGDKVIEMPNILRLRDLFYCAYRSACLIKDIPVKFNIYQFTDMLDESEGIVEKLRDAMSTAQLFGRGGSKGNPQQPAQ